MSVKAAASLDRKRPGTPPPAPNRPPASLGSAHSAWGSAIAIPHSRTGEAFSHQNAWMLVITSAEITATSDNGVHWERKSHHPSSCEGTPNGRSTPTIAHFGSLAAPGCCRAAAELAGFLRLAAQRAFSASASLPACGVSDGRRDPIPAERTLGSRLDRSGRRGLVSQNAPHDSAKSFAFRNPGAQLRSAEIFAALGGVSISGRLTENGPAGAVWAAHAASVAAPARFASGVLATRHVICNLIRRSPLRRAQWPNPEAPGVPDREPVLSEARFAAADHSRS